MNRSSKMQVARTVMEMKDVLGLSPLEQELLEVLSEKPMTRGAIVQILERPRTTVYDNLKRLQNKDLVFKWTKYTNTRGRPEVFFNLTDMPIQKL